MIWVYAIQNNIMKSDTIQFEYNGKNGIWTWLVLDAKSRGLLV